MKIPFVPFPWTDNLSFHGVSESVFKPVMDYIGGKAWFVLLLIPAVGFAEDANEIVRRADEKARGNTVQAEVVIQIVRPDWTREMSLKLWSKDRDKTLIVMTEPANLKRTAFLRRNREVWNWIPSLERTIKLPPSTMSQSWMGTDFTNEDFIQESSVVKDYTHTLKGEDTAQGRPTWIIELAPKAGSPAVWGMIKSWIDKHDYLELRTEFYNRKKVLVNTKVASDIKNMGGRDMPSRLEMSPAAKPGHKTVAIYRSLVLDKPIPDDVFTVRHLTSFK
jgi:outer membrane lipoprotein-sorting protein